jgi:hypothetical protein
MTLVDIDKELAQIEERRQFLVALASKLRGEMPAKPYDCQRYDPARLCMYERRADDRGCDGCQRESGA